MEKKYQVFISSTYTDLIEERQKVVEAVLNAGHIPAGMELFKAGPTQEETIKEWIEESDIYVLILGARYGSLNEEGISYTEWEYNLAKQLKKPMFSLVLKDEYIQKLVEDKKIEVKDVETSNSSYVDFKKEVMNSLVVQVEHPAEIRSGISDSIRNIEKNHSNELEGWIKGRFLSQLAEIRKENKELSDKLLSRQDQVINMQEEVSAVKDAFIGEYSFAHVESKLSGQPVISPNIISVVENLKEKLSKKTPNQENDTSDEKMFEKINSILEQKLSASQMLVRFKDDLLSHSMECRDNPYDIILNELYFSKWYEMSLVDKEDVPGRNVTFGTYTQYLSGYERIKLNDRGIKYLQMLEMEKIESYQK